MYDILYIFQTLFQQKHKNVDLVRNSHVLAISTSFNENDAK